MQQLTESFEEYIFEPEGVRVIVGEPANETDAKPIIIKLPGKTPGKTDVFDPDRYIMNFGTADPAGLSQSPKTLIFLGGEQTPFIPPLILRVRYTKGDWDRAAAKGKALSLAYYSEEIENWVVFGPEHNFHLERLDPKLPLSEGGFGVAELKHWGDPQKSWGTKLGA